MGSWRHKCEPLNRSCMPQAGLCLSPVLHQKNLAPEPPVHPPQPLVLPGILMISFLCCRFDPDRSDDMKAFDKDTGMGGGGDDDEVEEVGGSGSGLMNEKCPLTMKSVSCIA